jgi:arylformamidase
MDREALEALELPDGAERILFKTPNSRLWDDDHFSQEFCHLTGSGAQVILDRGVKLVGLDYLSVGDPDAHRLLLGAGVIAMEGLDLRKVEPGEYRLVALPLKIVGSDGAPARVVLIKE